MLEHLPEHWNSLGEVVLYGAGMRSSIAKKILDEMGIQIVCMLDRDPEKQNASWNGLPVYDFLAVKEEIKGRKIIITAGHTAYNQISSYLTQQGLQEFEDYCSFAAFTRIWFWNAKRKNYLYSVTMTVTTKCTLNCKKCNMFIPAYQEHTHIPLENLKRDMDMLFDRIDYVGYFGFIGGEPFLSPYLPDILQYLSEHYAGRYAKIVLTTNGTVLPSERLLKQLRHPDVSIDISDYTDFVPYKQRYQDVISMFSQSEINYNIRYSLKWQDFGFPETPPSFTDEEYRMHLQCCRPEWAGLNDGKFYFCNVAWSGEKSGHFQPNSGDYILLSEIDPSDCYDCHKIVELSMGACSFCKVCGGCGSDNTSFVPVGEQV